MPYLFAVLFLLALTALILVLMRRGWRNRERRIIITELPELPPGAVPATHGTHGVYVSTTLAGLPLERVVTRGLGVKSAVEVDVREDGIVLERQGAPSLFIPRASLETVGTTSGMIGKFAAADSIVVFTWSAGGTRVDTGVHIRNDADRAALFDAASRLTQSAPNESRDS